MTHENIEFEIKSFAPPPGQVDLLLAEFDRVKSSEQEDVYFDTVRRELFREGVFLRIRDKQRLDIKYNPNREDSRHFLCNETEYLLPGTPDEVGRFAEFVGQFL